jgi:hypothetical protein
MTPIFLYSIDRGIFKTWVKLTLQAAPIKRIGAFYWLTVAGAEQLSVGRWLQSLSPNHSWQLKHCGILPWLQQCQQHDLTTGELNGVVVGPPLI